MSRIRIFLLFVVAVLVTAAVAKAQFDLVTPTTVDQWRKCTLAASMNAVDENSLYSGEIWDMYYPGEDPAGTQCVDLTDMQLKCLLSGIIIDSTNLEHDDAVSVWTALYGTPLPTASSAYCSPAGGDNMEIGIRCINIAQFCSRVPACVGPWSVCMRARHPNQNVWAMGTDSVCDDQMSSCVDDCIHYQLYYPFSSVCFFVY